MPEPARIGTRNHRHPVAAPVREQKQHADARGQNHEQLAERVVAAITREDCGDNVRDVDQALVLRSLSSGAAR
jgi:hypothetical protein